MHWIVARIKRKRPHLTEAGPMRRGSLMKLLTPGPARDGPSDPPGRQQYERLRLGYTTDIVHPRVQTDRKTEHGYQQHRNCCNDVPDTHSSPLPMQDSAPLCFAPASSLSQD